MNVNAIESALKAVFGKGKVYVDFYESTGKLFVKALDGFDDDFKPLCGSVLSSFHDNHYHNLREHILLEHGGFLIHYKLCEAARGSGYRAFIVVNSVSEIGSQACINAKENFKKLKETLTNKSIVSLDDPDYFGRGYRMG